MRVLEPTNENIAYAASMIRDGGLVGMPTETVYGLAANALNPAAVERTFAAKGRPADNPLIVHIASPEQVLGLTTDFSEIARKLAHVFWPGPLTLVLPKLPIVPMVTTGGLDTVAIRVPAHPVARALIFESGAPVSAPSANRFMALSPTRADHISAELGLEIVLDGGPCEVGLESTVVDVSGDKVRLLRPGRISHEELEAVLGLAIEVGPGAERRSPGMYPRHYAPRTPVRLVDSLGSSPGIRRGGEAGPGQIALPSDALGYAAGLYAALHELDAAGLGAILVESPPKSEAWQAVWDRLRRATS